MKRRLSSVLFMAAAACSSDSEDVTILSPNLIGQGPVSTVPVGNRPGHGTRPELSVLSRGPRRVSVTEIERTWDRMAGVRVGTVQIPESMVSSLGEPDWLTVTEPNLEPSPLFMKFMTDLSILLCRSIIELDQARPTSERAVLPSGPDANAHLQTMLLRFWAHDVPIDDPEVVKLKAVHDAVPNEDPTAPWQAVCIALTTAPPFLLY